MRKRYLLLILVAAGLGLSIDLLEQYTSQPEWTAQELLSSEPDYYGVQLSHRTYNAEGKLEQQMRAASSHHYPDQQQSLLTQPELDSDLDAGAWSLKADEGLILDGSQDIRLMGGVILRTPNTGDLRDSQRNLTQIETERLDYLADQGVVTTRLPVSIVTPQGITRATGMTLHVERQRMELHSDVTTEYVQ
jgi:LPS export ABC transporter protein LptC